MATDSLQIKHLSAFEAHNRGGLHFGESCLSNDYSYSADEVIDRFGH